MEWCEFSNISSRGTYIHTHDTPEPDNQQDTSIVFLLYSTPLALQNTQHRWNWLYFHCLGWIFTVMISLEILTIWLDFVISNPCSDKYCALCIVVSCWPVLKAEYTVSVENIAWFTSVPKPWLASHHQWCTSKAVINSVCAEQNDEHRETIYLYFFQNLSTLSQCRQSKFILIEDKDPFSLNAKAWIPGGEKSIFSVVIYKWRLPLCQIVHARTIDEYAMPVARVCVTSQVNCGDITMLSQKIMPLVTMAKWAIDECF